MTVDRPWTKDNGVIPERLRSGDTGALYHGASRSKAWINGNRIVFVARLVHLLRAEIAHFQLLGMHQCSIPLDQFLMVAASEEIAHARKRARNKP